MTRISSLLRAAAFVATVATTPSLASTPAQDFIDHFSAQAVTPAASADLSTSIPANDFLVQLKGDNGAYVVGRSGSASVNDPRQQFIDQLADHSLNAKTAHDNLAAAN